MDSQNNQPQKPEDKRSKNNLWIIIMISVALILLTSTVYRSIVKSQYTQTTLSEFYDALQNDNLAEVNLRYDRVLYLTREEAAKPAHQQKACYTGLPLNGNLASDLTNDRH